MAGVNILATVLRITFTRLSKTLRPSPDPRVDHMHPNDLTLLLPNPRLASSHHSKGTIHSSSSRLASSILGHSRSRWQTKTWLPRRSIRIYSKSTTATSSASIRTELQLRRYSMSSCAAAICARSMRFQSFAEACLHCTLEQWVTIPRKKIN